MSTTRTESVDLERATRDFGDAGRALGLLLTCPDAEPLIEVAWAAGIEFFDQRGQTSRCRLWFDGEVAAARLRLEKAVEVANGRVTIQLLQSVSPDAASAQTRDLGDGASATIADMVERYPVVVLGDHGLQWGDTDAQC